jgi:hypothetical protein
MLDDEIEKQNSIQKKNTKNDPSQPRLIHQTRDLDYKTRITSLKSNKKNLKPNSKSTKC